MFTAPLEVAANTAAMASFFLSQAFAAMLLAGLVILAALLALAPLWPKRGIRNIRAKAGLQPQGRRLYLKLAIGEFDGIVLQLGAPFAKTLLSNLSAQLEQTMSLAEPVVLGDTALQIALPADTAATTDQVISEALAYMPETIHVEGLNLAIHISGMLLRDTADSPLPIDGLGVNVASMADSSDAQHRQNLAMLTEFSEALQENTLTLAYQPKLDLRTNAITSVEALLRWTRKDGTITNIADLISLVEATGNTKPLTFWVLRQAISDTCKMRDAGHAFRTYVNVSGSLLSHADFAETLIKAVAGNEALIGIEITETAVIADPETALCNLQAISRAGVSIAIDDFGAGVSSLEYLQRLPANELKIDRNFIATLSSSHRNPLIVRATIDLAHALEMRVTAEGVDDPLSIALLRVMGCDMAQGYLVSRPLPLPALLAFLESHDQADAAPAPLVRMKPQGPISDQR